MAKPVLNGLDLASQRITSVGTPTAAGDAATKSYTDPALRAKRLFLKAAYR